ncbi:hypothetical protein ABEW61_05895 [Paenibacillus amylolyticus]
MNGIKIVMIAVIAAKPSNMQEASRTLGCFFRLFIKILTFSRYRCKKLVTFSWDRSFIIQCRMEQISNFRFFEEMNGISRKDERDCWHEEFISQKKTCQEPVRR